MLHGIVHSKYKMEKAPVPTGSGQRWSSQSVRDQVRSQRAVSQQRQRRACRRRDPGAAGVGVPPVSTSCAFADVDNDVLARPVRGQLRRPGGQRQGVRRCPRAGVSRPDVYKGVSNILYPEQRGRRALPTSHARRACTERTAKGSVSCLPTTTTMGMSISSSRTTRSPASSPHRRRRGVPRGRAVAGWEWPGRQAQRRPRHRFRRRRQRRADRSLLRQLRRRRTSSSGLGGKLFRDATLPGGSARPPFFLGIRSALLRLGPTAISISRSRTATCSTTPATSSRRRSTQQRKLLLENDGLGRFTDSRRSHGTGLCARTSRPALSSRAISTTTATSICWPPTTASPRISCATTGETGAMSLLLIKLIGTDEQSRRHRRAVTRHSGEVKIYVREIGSGGQLSRQENNLRAHFGIGRAAEAHRTGSKCAGRAAAPTWSKTSPPTTSSA